jgi:hypothetical protein
LTLLDDPCIVSMRAPVGRVEKGVKQQIII